MKILMLCADWGIPVAGDAGCSVHLRELAASFGELGHEVRMLVANPSGATPLRVEMVETVPYRTCWPSLLQTVESARGGRREPAPRRDPAPDSEAAWSQAGLVTPAGHPAPQPQPASSPRECGAPSLGTRLMYQSLPALVDLGEELALYRFRFGRECARVIGQWRPDLVYERYALGQTGGWRASRSAGVPFFLEVNAPLVRERAARAGLGWGWRALSGRDERRLWSGSDAVFCVSEELRRQVVAAGAPEGRVITTPNGVDCSRFLPRRADGRLRGGGAADSVLIGWLGSLSQGRGVEEFLEMLAPVLREAPQARGVVIGGGPLMESCLARARSLGLEGRVVFTGAVAHREVPALLADLDIAVASYPAARDFYFSPMKVYEYMACALPVVAGSMGQMASLIRHRETGLLVPPGDDAAWSTALLELCDNPGLRSELGMNARGFVARGHSWRRNAEIVTGRARELQCAGGA